MEDQLKDLNKTLNNMMSNENKFTDKQRNQIRDKIARKRAGRFSFLRSNWKPITSTAISLILLFAIVQIAFDNMSADNASMSADQAESSAQLEKSSDLTKDHAKLERSDEATSSDAPIASLNKEGNKIQSPPLEHEVAKMDGPLLPLSDELVSVYENLKNTGDQRVLSKLGPFQVVQIYYHAAKNEDYETQYMMLYQNPAGTMPSKQLYLDEIAKDSTHKDNTLKKIQEMNRVERFNINYQIDPANRSEAYITWGGTGDDMKVFRLIRDQQKGVWTVTQYPVQ